MRTYSKRIMAFVLAFAMVLTSAAATSIVGNTAKAASKKVTLKFSKSSFSVNVGKTVSLKSKITKKNVKKVKSLTWSSTKKTIATVSKTGVVKGKKTGTTTIKCKVKYIAKGKKKVAKKTISTKVKVVAATPTAAPTKAPEGFKVKWNDKSNIGKARTVSIVGGTEESMTVKDNGSMRKELSGQYLIANEMGVGINLGNTMEATKAIGEVDDFHEATDFEQAWGAPITTQKYIDSIHSYGINTIRIPVAWTSMVSRDDKYIIDPKMLGRVEEIVNYALNNGMYVVINDHFDYGWWGAFGSADEKVREGAWARYRSYWTQIADRFGGYSDHLIFESGNEELTDQHGIPNGGLNSAINEDGYMDTKNGVEGILTEDEAYAEANKINQEFVNIIRASEKDNNKYRQLLIAGNGTDIARTCDLRFAMPKDAIEENGNTKLMVSVHYYTPWEFCGDGMNGATYTDKDKKITQQKFDRMKKFTDQGYGVIVGEMGVCNPLQDGVVRWLDDTIQISVKAGCVPCLWDTPGTYFDREECIMQFKDVAEYYNKITGAKGNTNIPQSTGAVKADVNVYSTIPDNAKVVFKWEGAWKKNKGDNATLDGGTATAGGIDQFVRTDSRTDSAKAGDQKELYFNIWGYQAFFMLDWKSLKNPVIKCEFEEDTEDAVGTIEFTSSKVKLNEMADGNYDPKGRNSKDTVLLEYPQWGGKYISIPAGVLKNLQDDDEINALYFTFGNNPMVKSMTIYDLG